MPDLVSASRSLHSCWLLDILERFVHRGYSSIIPAAAYHWLYIHIQYVILPMVTNTRSKVPVDLFPDIRTLPCKYGRIPNLHEEMLSKCVHNIVSQVNTRIIKHIFRQYQVQSINHPDDSS